jgi:Tol biopolymer transport system component
MENRNRYLPWLMIVLAGLGVAVILLRLQNRVRITAVHPAQGKPISIYGKIGLSFNQAMYTSSVEDRFTIEPALQGQITWEGNTLWFTPERAFDPDLVYTATLSRGAQALSGRTLGKAHTWQVEVRHPDLVYLSLDTTGGDLWRYEWATGITYPLTDTHASVIGFAPSPTGDQIAYVRTNLLGGSDLWLIDRDGTGPELLLDCRLDQCTQLAWSADAEWVAYERAAFDVDADRFLPSRVWTVNRQTGQTAPLYRQDTAYGHTPSFSPDGKRLATYDSVQNAIRIVDLESSQEEAIPTTYPSTGNWSPDGEELVFLSLVPGALEPQVAIHIANFTTQDVRDALGEFIPNMDYDPPQWSPDGEWIAYGARPVDAGISKAIWVKSLTGGEAFPITDDPSATYSGYRWDPWGERLIFQRYPLSGPVSQASIWLWERATGQTQPLIENGARPEWLP